jgi:hypothetical protein
MLLDVTQILWHELRVWTYLKMNLGKWDNIKMDPNEIE